MWLESFLQYLRCERNYSPLTIKEYEGDLRALELFYKRLDDTLDWSNLDADVARDWMMSMIDSGSAATSVNRRLSAVRSFYKYLLKMEWIATDPMQGLQGPRKKKTLPGFMREGEMDSLLDGDFFGDDFEGRRDKLMILMFYETGMRLSELTGLDWPDVDMDERLLRVTGKRRKQRLIPFAKELHQALCDYRELRASLNLMGTDAVFTDRQGVRLANAKVRTLVRHYLGFVTTRSKRSPHVLRHTFATSMLNHHADLETLRELLGHESVATTEIYTHTSFEELKAMYNQAHPRA